MSDIDEAAITLREAYALMNKCGREAEEARTRQHEAEAAHREAYEAFEVARSAMTAVVLKGNGEGAEGDK